MKGTIIFMQMALLTVGTVLGHEAPGGDAAFRAAAVTRMGRLEFDARVDTVFSLFTPLGEKHWAKGWAPEILFPLDREVAEGMVFQTHDEDGTAVWTVTRLDETSYTIGYNMVAPGLLVRRIQVQCRAAGSQRAEVTVSDSYVGLSEAGNAFVEKLDEAAYAAKMTRWREAIGQYLKSIAPPPSRQ